MAIRLPIERICPQVARWLRIMHMDHLFEFNSRVRFMLVISCVISLSYAIMWLMDFFQLSCFAEHPWTREGIGKWSCFYKLIGGIVLLMMFQQAAMVLAYYDEDGEDLRQKKEEFLGELEKQCVDVLTRATGQARKLFGMLSADLSDKVREQVVRMRKILQMVKDERDPAGQQIYTRLSKTMASHLHQLREPAMDHFHKLIAISKTSQFLDVALKRMRQQSMVEVLTGVRSQAGGAFRTQTLDADHVEGSLIFGTFDASFLPFGFSDYWDSQPDIKRQDTMAQRLKMPTEADLQDELQELSQYDLENFPDKAVLRPLRIVLKWFENIEPKVNSGGASPKRNVSRRGDSQLHTVWMHLRNSAFYKWMLVGILCALFLTYMYAHMTYIVFNVIREGECNGQMIFACIGAFFHQIGGVIAMLCYTVSLGVVLWNVDRLDAVLQVHKEIEELEDFKRNVDRLNAHDLTDGEASASMIQSMEDQLAEQKQLVAKFFNNALGRHVPLKDYEALAIELEEALEAQKQKNTLFPQWPAGGKNEEPMNDEEKGRLLPDGSEDER